MHRDIDGYSRFIAVVPRPIGVGVACRLVQLMRNKLSSRLISSPGPADSLLKMFDTPHLLLHFASMDGVWFFIPSGSQERLGLQILQVPT